MIIIKHQKGVGLMEVLVALLLLAIGVLGYTVLQLRAVDASSEALSRSQGMLILRGLAENIRANPAGRQAIQLQCVIIQQAQLPQLFHL